MKVIQDCRRMQVGESWSDCFTKSRKAQNTKNSYYANFFLASQVSQCNKLTHLNIVLKSFCKINILLILLLPNIFRTK